MKSKSQQLVANYIGPILKILLKYNYTNITNRFMK